MYFILNNSIIKSLAGAPSINRNVDVLSLRASRALVAFSALDLLFFEYLDEDTLVSVNIVFFGWDAMPL